MANINENTISRILSGLTTLNGSSVKMFIATGYIDSGDTLADFIPDHTSNSITVTAIRTTGSYDYYNGMVYLSAFKISFSNITTDYSSQYAIVGTYIDSGSPSTNYVISTDILYNPMVSGPTYYYFDNSRIFYLRDSDSSKNLYRNFREKLLTGTLGNLQTANIKIALVDNTYSGNFSINNHQYYSDISSYVVANEVVPGIYISGKSLKSSSSSITFTELTGTIVSGAIFYIDTGDNSTSTLIGYYGSDYISNTPYYPSGSTVTFKLYSNTIFDL